MLNNLQEYVCRQKGQKPGNYIYYSCLIENDFVRENLLLLREYNIPSVTIKKLSNFIPENISQDDVINFLKSNDVLGNVNLLDYEKTLINNNLKV